MPELNYDRRRSDMESKLAKDRLKEYYRWRYRFAPPQGWEVDHQVEQHPLHYQRYGSERIHHISNMIMVPREVNSGKNAFYNKPWEFAPERYQAFVPRARDTASSKARVLNIRDTLFLACDYMDDDDAWVLLTSFSKDALLIVIEDLKRTRYRDEPPEWFLRYPHWLARLNDDLEDHQRSIAQFLSHTRKLWGAP